MFLRSQSYDFDVSAHIVVPLVAESLQNLKFSLKGRGRKYDCISSRNFFRLLKTIFFQVEEITERH